MSNPRRRNSTTVTCRCHVPAMGHHFGLDLHCACGRHWYTHQQDPAACPNGTSRLKARDLEFYTARKSGLSFREIGEAFDCASQTARDGVRRVVAELEEKCSK